MPNLKDLLGDVSFVVVGATATALYMPVRQTQDIDILIRLEDADRAAEALRGAGAHEQGQLSIGGTSWLLADGDRLDVLESDEPWLADAMATSNRDAAGLPIVALPYLVLMKLRASRGIDLGDLSRMLGGASAADLALVRRAIRRWEPDAVDDLESIIELGRLEFEELL